MLYRQTDERWKNDIMTSPADLPKLAKQERSLRWEIHKDITQGDRIGRFGCLVTSLTNCYNSFYKDNKTPAYFNSKLRKKDGYYVLSQSYNCQVGQESFLNWDIAKLVFNFKHFRDILINKMDIKSENQFYIARIPYRPPAIMSGHYNMVVNHDKKNNIITHFDSDTGVYRVDWKNNDNYRIIEILF